MLILSIPDINKHLQGYLLHLSNKYLVRCNIISRPKFSIAGDAYRIWFPD